MEFEVCADRMKWDKFYLSISPLNKDIYFSSKYCTLHELNGEGECRVALFKGSSGTVVLYPFILKEITGYGTPGKYFDIETCYGYGGPVVENYNEDDINEFEDLFCTWCRENGIVAEFVRFHPLLDNFGYFRKNISKIKNRTTVFVDLKAGPDEIWKNYISSKNRNMIRKAEKSGVTVKVSNNFNGFLSLYEETMNKVNAGDYYYFSGKYYKNLFNLNNKSLFLLEAEIDGNTAAAALFLYSGRYLSYHLSGSRQEYLSCAPNNLLLYKAIELGCLMGLEKFHLGGGLSDSPDDSLFRFKNSFSPYLAEFYIGKRIHNAETYHFLMDEWKRRNQKEPELFLQYHY